MIQKSHAENTRRDAILAEALPLFLENGYEKTSIRMIAGKVGCEVGLVYYYFSTKDDVFESALNLYFENYKSALAEITENNKKDTALFFDALFAYLEKEAVLFSETFSEKVHWTVRLAVRAKVAELLKPYLSEAIAPLAERSRLPYATDAIVQTASDIIANAALHDEKAYFASNKEDIRRMISHLLGTDKNTGRRKDIPSFLL